MADTSHDDRELMSLRVDDTRESVDKLIALLRKGGATVKLNERRSRDGDTSRIYGTLTICF